MKSLIRNISFMILISLGFSSCIFEKNPDGIGEDGKIDPNTTILFLDVRALNPSTLTTPTEKIKSVRVIIIGSATDEDNSDDSDDPVGSGSEDKPAATVECNRLYEFPIVNASSFSYTLTWTSTLGKKSIYVIANEESVDDNLSAKLNQYEEMAEADDLEEWLQSYSFAPEYSEDGNTIYLPYSYSKTDFEPLPGKVNPVDCWLVPVATKFIFYFENKRSYPVRINGISMAYADTKNYLIPNIDKNAQNMPYGSESLYWPEWLAAVSQDSWNYPESGENEWFNQQNGWITAYNLPDDSESKIFTFIAKDSNDAFTVPAAEEKVTDEGTETVASTHTTDIFYLPESINYKNPETASTPEAADEDGNEQEQIFYLTIILEDLGPTGNAPKFENMPIPNLKALFRNTFVVIKMEMGQGDVEIYAEIAPWNIVSSNGWVSEGNTGPSNNPFGIKKK